MTMNKPMYFVVVAFAASLLTAPAMATDYHVFLLGGQSNMNGAAVTSQLPASLQAPQPDVMFYDDNVDFSVPTGWVTLRPYGYTGGSTFGPEVTFGRAMADANPQNRYALIKSAEGGTALYDAWKPVTGPTYNIFRQTVDTALEQLTTNGDTYQIDGMLWMQGESDSAGGYGAQYQQNLVNFIADMRSHYGQNMPFIIGQILPYFGSDGQEALVRSAQASIPGLVPYTASFGTDDLSNANGHYDAAGMQILGQRFADAYMTIVPEPATMSLLRLGAFIALFRRRK